MKKTLLLVAAVAILAAPVMAFHDDGVAHCNGCHTMHNSQDGVAMNFDNAGGPGTLPGTGYADLLLYPNKSDVCLNCHAGSGTYHVWGPGGADPLGGYDEFGAGDFMFLLEDNINDAHGGAGNAVSGDAAGHTIISGIFGTTADEYLDEAPGVYGIGATPYPSVDLACTSCHDPHGNENFRLLYQDGQETTSDTGVVIQWTSDIAADAIAFFGPGSGPETNAIHNNYRAGYSEWCSECHGDFHQASGALIHPSGEVLDTLPNTAGIYNAYNGTTDCITNFPTGGNPCGSGAFGTAYLAMVPIEDSTFVDTTNTEGATAGSSKVICASCHRAHATSAPDAGRWDFNVTGLAEDGGESGSYAMPNPFDAGQRSLCNKCHSKDEFDTPGIVFAP